MIARSKPDAAGDSASEAHVDQTHQGGSEVEHRIQTGAPPGQAVGAATSPGQAVTQAVGNATYVTWSLCVKEVPADGACLFRAPGDQP